MPLTLGARSSLGYSAQSVIDLMRASIRTAPLYDDALGTYDALGLGPSEIGRDRASVAFEPSADAAVETHCPESPGLPAFLDVLGTGTVTLSRGLVLRANGNLLMYGPHTASFSGWSRAPDQSGVQIGFDVAPDNLEVMVHAGHGFAKFRTPCTSQETAARRASVETDVRRVVEALSAQLMTCSVGWDPPTDDSGEPDPAVVAPAPRPLLRIAGPALSVVVSDAACAFTSELARILLVAQWPDTIDQVVFGLGVHRSSGVRPSPYDSSTAYGWSLARGSLPPSLQSVASCEPQRTNRWSVSLEFWRTPDTTLRGKVDFDWRTACQQSVHCEVTTAAGISRRGKTKPIG